MIKNDYIEEVLMNRPVLTNFDGDNCLLYIQSE